jgi:hypothetical protein
MTPLDNSNPKAPNSLIPEGEGNWRELPDKKVEWTWVSGVPARRSMSQKFVSNPDELSPRLLPTSNVEGGAVSET